ncbi:hypothetical protein J7L67_09180, partial [bacterium]|nr:hypothetical protein [bacterium]
MCNQSDCATRTYDGAAVIKRSVPQSAIMVTVLPIINPDENGKSNPFIAESIIGELLASGFIDVVPYRVMIEDVWEFYPGFFEVNPAKFSANPNDINFYGSLDFVQKQHIAPAIGCDYIIGGIYSPDRQKILILDLFSREENRIVSSFTQELKVTGSDLSAVKNVCLKITKYFFDRFSDDLVFRELTELAAQKISQHRFMEILDKWQSLYPDNLFVSAGMMIYYNKYIFSVKKFVAAGEKWFSMRKEFCSKQIRFFKS